MNQPIKYGSVCSGIEAATVAWRPLGWQPVWFSEIEPFPCKVLAHHYPNVPNLGDMTKLNEHKTYNNEPINLLVGGTPCQSFSIAGLRGGLDDERGNLALEYCRILIAKRPQWFVWENVPGVFSSNNGKDFANILSAFTGETVNPEGIGNAGVIAGDFYSIAWRVLDAQYFGVPQRRRRVFVVGHIGNDWRAPYAVLFERESLCRDFEAGAKARKGTTGTAEANTGSSGKWPLETAPTLDAHFATHWGQNNQHIDGGAGLFVEVYNEQGDAMYGTEDIGSTLSKRCHKEATDLVCHKVESFGAQNSHHQSMNLADVTPTFDKSKVPAICIQGSMIGRDDKNGPQGDGINNDVCFTLNTTDKHAIVYDTTQITSKANQSNPKEEICHTLAKGSDAPLLIEKQVTSIARRLTPLECERLQGFPDNFTNIPGAKDGPRYAAIGNSMAVPVMAWIGNRIQMFENVLAKIQGTKVA